MEWRAWQESNLRPLVPETNTLSSELQARRKNYNRIPEVLKARIMRLMVRYTIRLLTYST